MCFASFLWFFYSDNCLKKRKKDRKTQLVYFSHALFFNIHTNQKLWGLSERYRGNTIDAATFPRALIYNLPSLKATHAQVAR